MASDFFARQDLARRNSRMLTWLFILGVGCICLAMCLVALIVQVLADVRLTDRDLLPTYLGVAAATAAVIGLGSLWKTWELGRTGGRGIALALGGRQVPMGVAADHRHRVLLNVVEEMSIASGVPMPEVYVLDEETGINAFAAGWGPGDAVVAVTRGALDRLDRDELQGVIGHEFSHILNGDMRLNLRLIGVVHGMLLIALIGRMVLRSLRHVRIGGGGGSRKKDGGAQIALIILAVGVGLVVIGSVGWLFGQFIKAAVSRQREYLADAASVQFTRNPDGLARALAKIGGLGDGATRLVAPQAETASHACFGEALSPLVGWLATHPPIEERLRSLRAMGSTVVVADADAPATRADRDPGADAAPAAGIAAAAPVPAATLAARVGTVEADDIVRGRSILAAIPPAIRAAVAEPIGAQAVCFALVLDPRPEATIRQMDIWERTLPPAVMREIRHLREAAAAAPLTATLALAAPALRLLPPPQRRSFLRALWDDARRDGSVSMRELICVRYLDHLLSPRRPPGGARLAEHAPEAAILLAAVAAAGGAEQAAGAFGYAWRSTGLPETPMPTGIGGDLLDRACDRLEGLRPADRRILIRALAHCATDDAQVTPAEIEVIRLAAACLDVPVPVLAA